jgi:hypothetical protein
LSYFQTSVLGIPKNDNHIHDYNYCRSLRDEFTPYRVIARASALLEGSYVFFQNAAVLKNAAIHVIPLHINVGHCVIKELLHLCVGMASAVVAKHRRSAPRIAHHLSLSHSVKATSS